MVKNKFEQPVPQGDDPEAEAEQAEAEQAETEQAGAEQAGAEKPAAVIYCGPNLPRGILNQYTIYQNGIPAHLEKYTAACPAVVRLFVPVGQLTDTASAVAKAGTAQNVWFRQVIDFINGGAKA